MMLINEWFDNPLLGKLLFVIFDLLTAFIIQLLVEFRSDSQYSKYFVNDPRVIVSIWLFNPFVFTISSRGSYESLVQLLVLLTLYCERKK